jgi:D-glycero-D-manno-heptose 1,7-bisphosphate phosphatase
MNRAVFLDRDGVLVAVTTAGDAVVGAMSLNDFRLLPGIAAPLARLKAAGFLLVLVTNQPGIARGQLQADVLEEMHRRLTAAIPLDAIYLCPHADADNCDCRKPKPGMLLAAARKLSIDLQRSFFIGDTDRDRTAAEAAGVPFLLIDAPYNGSLRDARRVGGLEEAASFILSAGSA